MMNHLKKKTTILGKKRTIKDYLKSDFLIFFLIAFIVVLLVYLSFSIASEGGQCQISPLVYGANQLHEDTGEEVFGTIGIVNYDGVIYFNQNKTWRVDL